MRPSKEEMRGRKGGKEGEKECMHEKEFKLNVGWTTAKADGARSTRSREARNTTSNKIGELGRGHLRGERKRTTERFVLNVG